MRLEAIEQSELVALMSSHRPAGQLFIPGAVLAMEERYHFQVLPTVEDIGGEVLEFKHGVYNDAAFDFSLYRDGAIIRSASDTAFLDAVLQDILAWAEEALGLIATKLPPNERHYASNLVVSGNFDFSASLEQFSPVPKFLSNHLTKYGLNPSKFEWDNISFAVDPASYPGRKPVKFILARRANQPFADNIFFSSAPLSTSDHIRLLETLEGKQGKRKTS